MDKEKRILITGGHLTPALAVVTELKELGYSNFIWVGHKHAQVGDRGVSAEYLAVEKQLIPFVNLITGKLMRDVSFTKIPLFLWNFVKIGVGLVQSIYIIIRYRPKLILSFGGYLAVPLVVIAKIFRIKVITHEQTVVAGLANRIIAKFADRILLSWPSSTDFFPVKAEMVGNPVRREILRAEKKKLFDNELPVTYITGGNQGSAKINQTVWQVLPKLLEITNVIHQTGTSTHTKAYEKALEIKEQLDKSLGKRYVVHSYLHSKEVAEVLVSSDLVISRSGANTITELLVLGKVCILVPIPWTSHNEQGKNAEMVAGTGLGYILNESELAGESFLSAVTEQLAMIDTKKNKAGRDLTDIQTSAKKLVKEDAARIIAGIVIELLD